jgi:hypothetical protein
VLNDLNAWVGWDWIALVASVIGLIASGLFVVRYWISTGGHCWKNPFGRFLITRKMLLVGLFSLILFNRYQAGTVHLPDSWEGQGLVTAILYSAFALHTFVPYRLLVNAQQQSAVNEEARQ